MIGALLIANRGEIACRVIRTARRLGIRTVAVYSDADAQALHVRQADQAVHIGPSPARESYLVGERIIAAALETGAEAIHPGYGFLSENADFAQGVIDAGLIWVGPKPHAIRAMGLKDAAKKLMSEAGVPVTPGYLGEDQSPDTLQREADAIGYPVLIKAVAGGGGKGMRRVESAAEFADMLLSCKREAASSFGDDRVLLEKYISLPRISSAGLRRQSRPSRPPVRTRLLAPAPPPEGHRGAPRARHGPGDAGAGLRRRRPRRQGSRL
jgi:3-methylcrotonyl-CoA carboxylase alpha subunit